MSSNILQCHYKTKQSQVTWAWHEGWESSYSICKLKGRVEYSVFRQNTYKDNGDRCLPTSYEGLKFNLQVGSCLWMCWFGFWILDLVWEVQKLLLWHLLATRELHASNQRSLLAQQFTKDSLPSGNPEHRFHWIFLHWWNSLICPINSNSDHLCPSDFHNVCLVVWERQEITLSINIDTGQMIPQLWHKKPRPSDLMFCWHLWEPGITCDTYSRQFLSMGFSWWSFSFCAHKNNIS